jgi:hypothetical protein
MPGGVTDERAPAAADVEQGFSRLEPQLAADHVELVSLRGGEIVVPVFKIGAGVNHLRIEKEFVKAVRDVVVIVDVGLVGRLGTVGARLAHGFERPGPAARHEKKPRERAKCEALVERFHQFSGAPLRPSRGEIEKRSVAQIEP